MNTAGNTTGNASNLCLQPIMVANSPTNFSEFIVPVIIMKPGTSANITILYKLLVNGASGASSHSLPNITRTTLPNLLSVDTGRLAVKSEIAFKNATLLLQQGLWRLFEYDVTAASNASGYYAILPPIYYGFYPALAVESNPNELNSTALSMWGFNGTIESGEFIIPSTIVGTSSNLNVVNATELAISTCPNSACSVIIHSGL
jgi:hypothetical protein